MIEYYIILYWICIIVTPLIDNILYSNYRMNTAFSFVILMSSGVFILFFTLLYIFWVIYSNLNKKEKGIPPQKPTD